ncbi:MAG: hypothetical protein KJ893_02965, partial [Candidatus Omnitrophica bacterium]|nr:hypothetical protein [Candidatus Omnitrophota bacterium]MBU4478063.1 hypothetical protein [Candidatus Omnitrophota bacterium]MCG2710739.1 hypothetical protein [Candidatus Omnitrophota bacterium]
MLSFNLNNMKPVIITTLVVCLILNLVSLSYIQDGYADSFLKARVETVSGPQMSGLEQVKQVLRNLKVPKDIGFIKEVHVPQNPAQEMIINIQDLHCNYPAQKNIAKILDHLCTTYGIRLISVEGGSGKIDTTFYK